MSVVDFVSSLRPARLIGTVLPLCTWKDYFKSNINKIKGGDVRKYYEEQNHLIEKFAEIDNFLDAGKIHYNMLRNYGSDVNESLGNIDEGLHESSRAASPDNLNGVGYKLLILNVVIPPQNIQQDLMMFLEMSLMMDRDTLDITKRKLIPRF